MSEDLAALLSNAEPLKEEDERYSALRSDLQCNILSAHGRKEARYYPLRFTDVMRAKYLIGLLPRNPIERAMVYTTADSETLSKLPESTRASLIGDEGPQGAWLFPKAEYDCIEDLVLRSEQVVRRRNRTAKSGDDPGDFAVNVLLTARGYAKLTNEPLPTDRAFREGMAARKGMLNDPDPPNPNPDEDLVGVDALVIVAYDPCLTKPNQNIQAHALATLENAFNKYLGLTGKHVGRQLTVKLGAVSPSVAEADRDKDVAIEPFGFRDGIARPLFYGADLDEMNRRGVVGAPASATDSDDVRKARERARQAAFAPLGLALCPDPNGKAQHACGSYFVFRKLAQNIEKFCEQVETLTVQTGRSERDVLGQLVGRLRDGTPLAGQEGAGTDTFDYTDDSEGKRCPFHAHIRKANPRGDHESHGREQRIVRHAMPYGPSIDRTPMGEPVLTHGRVTRQGAAEAKPNDIGLLFICAQGNIEKQFERIQVDWANNPLFAWGKMPGADTIIGQRKPGEPNRIRMFESPLPKYEFNYAPVVTFCGGDYFFAPSISFLRGLHDGLWT